MAARWTADELARAVAMRRAGQPLREIAAALKRSEKTTCHRLCLIGERQQHQAPHRPRALPLSRYDIGRPDYLTAPARLLEWERFEAAFAGVRFTDADEPPFAPRLGWLA